jgi:hypothetical protein
MTMSEDIKAHSSLFANRQKGEFFNTTLITMVVTKSLLEPKEVSDSGAPRHPLQRSGLME